jgi:O-antigen/teichoic acid export membrane protein
LSQGEAKFVGKLSALTTLITVSLATILIPIFGAIGLILTSLTAGWPAYVTLLRKAQKKYGVNVPFQDLKKLYLSGLITGLVVVFIAILFKNHLLSLFLGGIVGIIVYALMTILTRSITRDDIDNLRQITKQEPIVGRIVGILLKVMERIGRWFNVL